MENTFGSMTSMFGDSNGNKGTSSEIFGVDETVNNTAESQSMGFGGAVSSATKKGVKSNAKGTKGGKAKSHYQVDSKKMRKKKNRMRSAAGKIRSHDINYLDHKRSDNKT